MRSEADSAAPPPAQEPVPAGMDFRMAAGIAGGIMLGLLIVGLIGVVKKENK